MRRIHPLAVRMTHWINAAAIILMISSGWQIYNASPLFPFVFPPWMTLGGWLGGALAWHFAAMWLLAVNFASYLGYGLISGHIRRRLLPLYPREVRRDANLALCFRLPHDGWRYNAVQRLLYVLAGCGIALAITSGLAIWKLVQLSPLTELLGGYEIARRVHFAAMAGIAGFVIVHLALVAIVPRTLPPMLTGRAFGAPPAIGDSIAIRGVVACGGMNGFGRDPSPFRFNSRLYGANDETDAVGGGDQ